MTIQYSPIPESTKPAHPDAAKYHTAREGVTFYIKTCAGFNSRGLCGKRLNPPNDGHPHKFVGRVGVFLCELHHLEQVEYDKMRVRMLWDMDAFEAWLTENTTLGMGFAVFSHANKIMEKIGAKAEELLRVLLETLPETDAGDRSDRALIGFIDLKAFEAAEEMEGA